MPRRKSILLIGNYPPPFGGVPRHLESLAPYLTSKGWNVHVLSGGRGGIECREGITVYKLGRNKKLRSFIVSPLRLKIAGSLKLKSVMISSPRQWMGYMLRVAVGREMVENCGARLISAYNLFSGAPIGAVLSEQYGIPLVVTNFGEIYSHTNYLRKNEQMVKYVCAGAKKLLAISHHCAQSYKLLSLTPEVQVIPYGVSTEVFSPKNDGGKIRRALGIEKSDKVVLFVGRMIADMGLHTLMEAIRQIVSVSRRVKFLIVGATGDLLPSALQLSTSYKKNVFVFSNVPFDELPFYYAASNIVVVPTRGDRACGSLAALEGMATGRPVIASEVGGIPELVVDGKTGLLIPPEKPNVLKETIINILGDESLLIKMGAYARERVESLFDERKTLQRIECLFSEVAGI